MAAMRVGLRYVRQRPGTDARAAARPGRGGCGWWPGWSRWSWPPWSSGAEAVSGASSVRASFSAFLLVGQVPVAQAARGRRWLGAVLLVVLYLRGWSCCWSAFPLVVTATGCTGGRWASR